MANYDKIVDLTSVIGEGTMAPAKPVIETRDPKYILKELLLDNLNPDALTKDDGATHAKYLVMYAEPPWTLIKDFLLLSDYELIISVARVQGIPQRHVQNKPKKNITLLPVAIWTVDKPGVSGSDLRWKAYADIRRVFRENADVQRLRLERDDDHLVEGKKVYNTILLAKHVAFWWDWDEQPYHYWHLIAFLDSWIESHIPHQAIPIITSTESSHAPETTKIAAVTSTEGTIIPEASKIALITSIVSDRAP